MLTLHPHTSEQPPAGLEGFVDDCASVDGHAPFDEHTMLALRGVQQLPHTCVLLRDHGVLSACAVLSEGLEGWSFEAAVRPESRGRGLGRLLVEQVVDHVGSHGGGVLRSWVHAPAGAALALAARWGAATERRLLVLTRHLDDLPVARCHDGVFMRQLDTTDVADRSAWLSLSNAAFRGHPDNGGWTHQELDWRMQAAWTAASRFPVAVDHDGLVAGVWTKVERDSTLGELYVVAVHPRARGRQLGRLVVAQALRDLRAHGCRQVELYVDAENATALHLYRWSGFMPGVEHHRLSVQVPDARPVQPATRA